METLICGRGVGRPSQNQIAWETESSLQPVPARGSDQGTREARMRDNRNEHTSGLFAGVESPRQGGG